MVHAVAYPQARHRDTTSARFTLPDRHYVDCTHLSSAKAGKIGMVLKLIPACLGINMKSGMLVDAKFVSSLVNPAIFDLIYACVV